MRTLIMSFWLLLCLGSFSVEMPPGVDWERIQESRRAERMQKSSAEVKTEQDLIWMAELFQETRQSHREITSLEASRIEAIYEGGSSREEKTYAFSMLPLFQDVSRWSRELEILLQSEDPEYVRTAVGNLEARLNVGSEREKIMLSNNERVLALLGPVAERFPGDELLQKKIAGIGSLTEPYKGKALPKAEDRPLESKRQPVAEPPPEGMGIPAKIAMGLIFAAVIVIPLWKKFGRGQKS